MPCAKPREDSSDVLSDALKPDPEAMDIADVILRHDHVSIFSERIQHHPVLNAVRLAGLGRACWLNRIQTFAEFRMEPFESLDMPEDESLELALSVVALRFHTSFTGVVPVAPVSCSIRSRRGL
jgi:hypothetical protein